MTIKMVFKKEHDKNGFIITKLTHAKAVKDGKYFKFAKHTDKLLQILQSVDIEVPDEVVE